MKTQRFEVLSQKEIEQIHNASLEVLEAVGIRVDYDAARDLFRQAGALVDEATHIVRFTGDMIMRAVAQAPGQFTLYGPDGQFALPVGGDQVQFAALGTPTRMLDPQTGEVRPSTLSDLVRHIQLIDGCENIHGSQMDVWPNDIEMTTIHSEAIFAWVQNSKKSFGMGCYGFLPTLDMMRMMALVAGGKQALREKPRFMAICSVVSPLQMAQVQAEGLLICADYGQPLAISPEGIAGATSPVTLAGLLVQENANILAHIALAQIFRPGTPVLYGTVSTIANMRLGTVALGSVETGLITAASAQLARFYGLPCRSVGAATESKIEDIQAGIEKTSTLLPAVLAGVNYITAAGTLDSTMMESEALLMLDDELCGALLRMARGIEVNNDTLALDLIHKLGASANYLAEEHTAKRYRSEHFMPRFMSREPYETWKNEGRRGALDLARDRANMILKKHQAYAVQPDLLKALNEYRQVVAQRTIEEFYAAEMPEYQNLSDL